MLASGAVLLDTATSVRTGEAVRNYAQVSTYQATGRTWTGIGGATVKIEVSNDGLAWLEAGEIKLALTDAVSTCGFVMTAPWSNVRARLSAISGTGAYVTVTMGA
jgi:hypothetical protein